MAKSSGGGPHGGWWPKGVRKRWQTVLGGGPPPPKAEPKSVVRETAELEPSAPIEAVPDPKPRTVSDKPLPWTERRKRPWVGLGAAACVALLAVWLLGKLGGIEAGSGSQSSLGTASGILRAGNRGARAKPDEPEATESLEINGFLTPEESKKLAEETPGIQIDLDKLPRPEEPIILLDPKRTVAPMLSQSAAPDVTAEPP